MKHSSSFKSDSSGQTIILAGFVIAVIIVGMGSVLYSAASSGHQKTPLQTDVSFDYFDNVREEYGVAMMVSSDHGELDPFNISYSVLPQFEDKMKTIVESHGYIVNFSWVKGSYSNETKWANVNILFSDGNKLFNDTVTYNLVTGKIVYDIIPPGNIFDLEAETYSVACDDGVDGAIFLNWTAVGDDGYENETSAYTYDIRYNKSQIYDLEDFSNSNPIPHKYSGIPKLNGLSEIFIVYDLDTETEWFFAIRVIDDAGNPSNLSEPNYINATASSWRPEIHNISINNAFSNYSYYEAAKDDNINISFQIKDKEDDKVTVSIIVRNVTIMPDGSENYGDWFEGDTWSELMPGEYNTNYNYTFNLTKIDKSWDYYFNVSDNDTSCNKNRTVPFGAPDNYYSIEIPDKKYSTMELNWTFVNDTYIDKTNQPANFGDKELIKLKDKTSNPKFGLIKFNLSSITGLDVEFANISLYVNSSNTNIEPVYFYKIDSPWDENTVNWDSLIQDNLNGTQSASGIPIAGGYVNWTISKDEINYLLSNQNNGWLIKFDSNSLDAEFNSKDADIDSIRPVLYVTYAV